MTAPTLERLRARAAANHRSLNGELLGILERSAVEPPHRVRAVVHDVAPEPYAAGVTRDSAPSLADTVDREALAAVCRRHHIRSLAVFGSGAREEDQPESDVDVVVEFEPGMTPGFGIVRVAEALRPVLGGRRVDLVTRRGLSPRLREQVLATARPLYDA